MNFNVTKNWNLNLRHRTNDWISDDFGRLLFADECLRFVLYFLIQFTPTPFAYYICLRRSNILYLVALNIAILGGYTTFLLGDYCHP